MLEVMELTTADVARLIEEHEASAPRCNWCDGITKQASFEFIYKLRRIDKDIHPLIFRELAELTCDCRTSDIL